MEESTEADDMAEMQREFRQSQKDEAIEKEKQLPKDDQYFSQLNFNDTEEKSKVSDNRNQKKLNKKNNTQVNGNAGPGADGEVKVKDTSSQKWTLSYQRGKDGQKVDTDGVRKIKLVLRHAHGHNLSQSDKIPAIKFDFDLHKDDPYTLASQMSRKGLISESELIGVANSLAKLQVKHRYTYAMSQQNQVKNIFTDLATPESFPVHVKSSNNSLISPKGSLEVKTKSTSISDSANNAKNNSQNETKVSATTPPSGANRNNTNNDAGKAEEVKAKQKQQTLEKIRLDVSQGLINVKHLLQEVESLAKEKDREATVAEQKKKEEQEKCGNIQLSQALGKELFVLNNYSKNLAKIIEEIEEKQDKCNEIERRMESLDAGINNTDIDDREDENDRRKIKELREKLAKDTEERKRALKQMESQPATVNIPSQINEEMEEKDNIGVAVHIDINNSNNSVNGSSNMNLNRAPSGSFEFAKTELQVNVQQAVVDQVVKSNNDVSVTLQTSTNAMQGQNISRNQTPRPQITEENESKASKSTNDTIKVDGASNDLNTKKVNNVDTNNASGGLVNKIDAPSNGTNDTRSNKTNTVNQEESKIKPVANNVDNSGVLKKKDSTDNSSNQ